MSIQDKVVVRILLLAAKFLAKDDWKKEIDSLASHIIYSVKEAA